MSSFKGNGKTKVRTETYDSVMRDKTLSAGAKVIWIIMRARGTQVTADQIVKDTSDLHELMCDMQNELENL